MLLRSVVLLLVVCVVWGGQNPCEGDTTYYLTVSLPWNKKTGVLPRYHLAVSKLIFIVHSERFRPWKEGRVVSNGLAKLAETGETHWLKKELQKHGSGTLIEVYESPFTANVTMTPTMRYLTIAGRIERTPDWFIGSKNQNLCNEENFFGGPGWKNGDYEDLRLMDAGTKLTPIQRSVKTRPLRPISYSRQTGYTLNTAEPVIVGSVQALQRACPVFGAPAYAIGVKWKDGPCTECECMDINKDVCVRQHCAPPTCEYFVFEPHICCPVCQDQEAYHKLLEKVRNPDKPVIVKKPRNMTVPIGSSFTVDCTAWGDPKPQVTVSRNEQGDYPHIHLEMDRNRNPGLASSNIKIGVATEGNVGRYTCFVNSASGEVEAHAYITISNELI